MYIRDGEAAKPADPLVSLVFHERLAQLPPVWLATSDMDPTSVGALILRDMLVEAHGEGSGRIVHRAYNGYPHNFFLVPVLEMTEVLVADWVGAVQSMCS